jgi:ADP-heptose:LPS heptosyltransferase
MRGRYLVRNRVANAGLVVADAALGALYSSRGTQRIPESPERILIATGGHLGDAVIATAMLADLHEAFPGAALDVLAPSWNAAVFEGHPFVRRVHCVDHWKVNRAPLSRAAKIARYVSMARAAASEISNAKYDVAIDSYPFFPNMAGVLWRAGIPIRVGYASGGFGPLYTHATEWVDDREHIAEKQRRLTRLVTRERTLAAEPAYRLAPDTPAVEHSLNELLDRNDTRPVVLLHAGAGSVQKDWPLEHWTRLAAELVNDGSVRVLLTGAGARDASIARQIAQTISSVESLVDQLSWSEFVGVVRRAALVVSGDTSAAHVAAACGTPHVALFTGINDASEFRPLSKRGAVLMHPVPCAPCFRGEGCTTMACIRQIAPDHVLRTGLALLSKG